MKAWKVYPAQSFSGMERRHEVIAADAASFAGGVIAFLVDDEPVRVLGAAAYSEVVGLGEQTAEQLAALHEHAAEVDAEHAEFWRRISPDADVS